jgi:hypothetical protein
MDIPESVLAQLGNRVQHALRAFTPNDAENLRKTVKTYPRSDFYEIDRALTSMGIGQALITVLSEKGIPTEVAVTHLAPPRSVMGPLPENEFRNLFLSSEKFRKYEKAVDRLSAREILSERINQTAPAPAQQPSYPSGRPAKPEKSMVEQVMGSSVGRQIGRELVRGVFGMLFGTRRR